MNNTYHQLLVELDDADPLIRQKAAQRLGNLTWSNASIVKALQLATWDKDKIVADAARQALAASVHQEGRAKLKEEILATTAATPTEKSRLVPVEQVSALSMAWRCALTVEAIRLLLAVLFAGWGGLVVMFPRLPLTLAISFLLALFSTVIFRRLDESKKSTKAEWMLMVAMLVMIYVVCSVCV